MNKQCTGCVVSAGTHKPAEELHQQIAEPQTQQPEALRQAEWLRKWFGCDGEMAAVLLERQQARIAELEYQLDAIGAGGVEPLRGNIAKSLGAFDHANSLRSMQSETGAICTSDAMAAAAPQAAQAAVPLPLLVRDIARDLGITVPQACIALKPLGNYSTNSAVTAEMARMLRDHFPAPAHPAEGVPAQAVPEIDERAAFDDFFRKRNRLHPDTDTTFRSDAAEPWKYWKALAALAATQPAAQAAPEDWPTEEMTNAFGENFSTRKQAETFPKAFRAALAAAPRKNSAGNVNSEFRCSDCKTLLAQGYACGACGSDLAEDA